MFLKDLKGEQLKYYSVREFLDSEIERLGALIKEYKEDIKEQGGEFNRDNPIGGMYAGTELTEIHYEMEKKMAYSQEASNDIFFYKKLRLAPYFARVVFKADGALKERSVYIGLRTLQDPDTFEMYVCDWRAPIASLFYGDFEDKAYFEAPRGRMYGDLLLKRQFKFENGELKYYVDSDLKIDDDILRDVLSSATGEQLRVIVNSIQREQNRVVRYSDNENLLVTGPAGSGKTSVGFHRLAYLLYQNRKELASSEIVMFSNNDIFSGYVADIIPELGEMPINYASFYSIFAAELPTLTVSDYYSLADEIICGNRERLECARIKTGKDFLDFLECGANGIEPDFCDVLLHGNTIISAGELLERFKLDDENSPKSRGERLAAFCSGVIDEYFTTHYKEIFAVVDEDTSIDEDSGKLVKKLRRETKTKALEMIRNAVLTDPCGVYIKLLNEYADKTQNPRLKDTLKSLKQGVAEFEDALGIVYVKGVLGTAAVIQGVKHILIDEAQDLSFVQHKIIKRMFPRARFTLLADTNQALIDGINTVDENSLAQMYSAKTLRLDRSYRSTSQINNFALEYLPEEKRYEIFSRDGNEVEKLVGDEEQMIEKICGHTAGKTLCVITKTANQARDLYKKVFARDRNIRLCDNKSCRLSSAPVIMPLPLTKGLEFDSVVIDDRNGDFSAEGNERFMYLASTRALHELTVFTTD